MFAWVQRMSDHPIFTESIRRIRELLVQRAAADQALAFQLARLSPLEREVLERCIHSAGDASIATDLVFAPAAADGQAAGVPAQSRQTDRLAASRATPAPSDAPAPLRSGALAPHSACERALAALVAGAPILTDTAMAAAAVAPMARRTLGTAVHNLLAWAPVESPANSTRSAAAVAHAWRALAAAGPPPLLLIGSAPTALEVLLDLVASGAVAPSLVIGMPVGFVGVAESKRRLAASGLPQIRLEGSRGGAGLAAAACNALLRAARRLTESPPQAS